MTTPNPAALNPKALRSLYEAVCYAYEKAGKMWMDTGRCTPETPMSALMERLAPAITLALTPVSVSSADAATSIREARLSKRAVNVLSAIGCETLGDVAKLNWISLVAAPNCGQVTRDEIMAALHAAGLSLSDSPLPAPPLADTPAAKISHGELADMLDHFAKTADECRGWNDGDILAERNKILERVFPLPAAKQSELAEAVRDFLERCPACNGRGYNVHADEPDEHIECGICHTLRVQLEIADDALRLAETPAAKEGEATQTDRLAHAYAMIDTWFATGVESTLSRKEIESLATVIASCPSPSPSLVRSVRKLLDEAEVSASKLEERGGSYHAMALSVAAAGVKRGLAALEGGA